MDRIEEMIQNLELLRMHFGDITKTCMTNGIIDSTIKAIEKLATYENAEKHGLPERYEAEAKDTPTEKPQTNADRIRSMTDEELAEVLFGSCIEHMGVEECSHPEKACKSCVLDWLKAESEEKYEKTRY